MRNECGKRVLVKHHMMESPRYAPVCEKYQRIHFLSVLIVRRPLWVRAESEYPTQDNEFSAPYRATGGRQGK